MKFKELKTRPTTDLQKILTESRQALRELRFKVASKQLKNVREIRDLKKRISRIMFLLSSSRHEVNIDNRK